MIQEYNYRQNVWNKYNVENTPTKAALRVREPPAEPEPGGTVISARWSLYFYFGAKRSQTVDVRHIATSCADRKLEEMNQLW